MNMMNENFRSDHEDASKSTPIPARAEGPALTDVRVRTDVVDQPADAGANIARFNACDLDNARRFVAQHGGIIRFDHTFDEWRYFDRIRWVKDTRKHVMELLKQTAEATYADALRDGNKESIRQARNFRNYHGLRNALVCASSMPELAVTAEDWDRDVDLFNVQNGTIDLKKRQVRPHQASDLITMVAGCRYEPGQVSRFFTDCLATYWPNYAGEDDGIIEFLMMTIGYCLSGRDTEKMFMLLVGTGDTGKTTFMHGLEAVWGDYFRTADWSSFSRQRDNDGAKHRTDLARLLGARIVSASEGEEGCRMSDGIIKRLTGRVKLVVRDLMSKPFELPPTFKLFLDTNYAPHFKGQDLALRNRVRRVPFRHIITKEMQGEFRRRYGNLDHRLEEDAPGILNMALQGWDCYREKGGVEPPQTIKDATNDYMDAEDLLGEFIRDRCEPEAESRLPRTELFRQYQDWSKEVGELAMSARRFYSLLLDRDGIKAQKSTGTRLIQGLAVRKSMSDRAQEHGLFGGG